MESFEKRSADADAQADRLAEEGERVDRDIAEARSDWESKKGQVPGMEPREERDDPAAFADVPEEEQPEDPGADDED